MAQLRVLSFQSHDGNAKADYMYVECTGSSLRNYKHYFVKSFLCVSRIIYFVLTD